MAKVLSEAQITTRNARSRLAKGMHWRGLDPEVHLGYRKGARGGTWIVRWRQGAGYKQTRLGTADDAISEGTLDYYAAAKKARETVEQARLDDAALAAGPDLTVRKAVEDYVATRDARESRRAGRAVRSNANTRLGHYVTGLPPRGKREMIVPAPLADVLLHKLTEANLRAWRQQLPEAMKPASLQRLINDFKAALNMSCEMHREKLPPALPGIIKHGLKLTFDDGESPQVARDNQILTEGEIARLLRAAREVDSEQGWDGDLFRVVLVLAATGARFSQIARMRVADCQHDYARLMIPASRKGKGGRSGHITMPVGRDVLDELVPITTGRAADETLLQRWRHKQAPGSIKWERDKRGRWWTSSEFGRAWGDMRQRAGLPEAIPYALRHSSIVRGIKANLPIRLVAALHDTSVQMIERHYAKWITDGLEDMARDAIVPMVPDRSKVVELSRAR